MPQSSKPTALAPASPTRTQVAAAVAAVSAPTADASKSATLAGVVPTDHTGLEAKSSTLPPRHVEEGESKLSRKYQGGSTSRKHLANDTSATATKVPACRHVALRLVHGFVSAIDVLLVEADSPGAGGEQRHCREG